MQGYIKLYRELIGKPIWLNSTPEQKAVLITLLLMANHCGCNWEWKGEPFKVNPGQFVTSLEAVKKKGGKGISIQNIRSSLKRFKKLGFLTNKSTKSGRLITIVNWDSYQPHLENPTKNPTKTQQRPNKDPTPNKNERKKEEGISPPNFKKFWEEYPRKIGKGAALKAYQKIKNPKPMLSEIITSIEDHVKSKQWQDKEFIPYPTTWLNQRRWEDEICQNETNEHNLSEAEIMEKYGVDK